MQTLPILYHKGKSGAIYSWRIWTEGDIIHTEYGQVDGLKSLAAKRAKAKNVGRANETTPERQAELEALSMWQNKRDRKYSETPDGTRDAVPLPMLANSKKWEPFARHRA